MTETKDQILDAAERLFAAEGIASTSIRAILAEAGLNPAAIHYHFGGKDALVEALLSRRLDPINAERLQRFEALDARSAAGTLDLRAVVRAYVEPAVRAARAEEGERFLRFVGRLVNESSEEAGRLMRTKFQPVVRRFVELLQRARPGLETSGLALRVHFLVGAMFHLMSCREHLNWVLEAGSDEAPAFEHGLEDLVEFACAGLAAPSPRFEVKR